MKFFFLLKIHLWFILFTQDACSPVIEQLIFFHDYSIIIIIIIIIIISYIILILLSNSNYNFSQTENQILELIWTILPIIILGLLAIPSLKILYLTDEIYSPFISIKINGHQWYWNYEYPDFFNIEFDSFLSYNFNKFNYFRLIDVDNRVILPFNVNIRLLITSSDVIHSWTIPSIGIKIDATPGRLNQINLISSRPSLNFGQCSEICGINHRFIPIIIESTNLYHFLNWIKSYIY